MLILPYCSMPRCLPPRQPPLAGLIDFIVAAMPLTLPIFCCSSCCFRHATFDIRCCLEVLADTPYAPLMPYFFSMITLIFRAATSLTPIYRRLIIAVFADIDYAAAITFRHVCYHATPFYISSAAAAMPLMLMSFAISFSLRHYALLRAAMPPEAPYAATPLSDATLIFIIFCCYACRYIRQRAMRRLCARAKVHYMLPIAVTLYDVATPYAITPCLRCRYDAFFSRCHADTTPSSDAASLRCHASLVSLMPCRHVTLLF